MSRRFDQLRARHSNLRTRCAVQRNQLAHTTREIESRLGGIDRGINAVRNIARNPVLLAAGVAVIVLLRPRRLMGWASRGLLFYTSVRRMGRLAR